MLGRLSLTSPNTFGLVLGIALTVALGTLVAWCSSLPRNRAYSAWPAGWNCAYAGRGGGFCLRTPQRRAREAP
jgi:hypothetical protein